MAEPSRRTIIALDLLRFASALMVVLYHFGSAFARAPSPVGVGMLAGLPLSSAGVAATWFGWVGVELFFVISGFVIAMSAQGASASSFLRRRVLRLLPAAWICATVTLVVLAWAAPSLWLPLQWLMSVTFWPVGAGIDPSYWTLGIELVFYMLIAAGLGEAGTLTGIERRALWIGALSTGFWLWALFAGWSAPEATGSRQLQLLLLPHGCFFALGILAWAMLHDRVTVGRVISFTLFTAIALVEIAAHAIERIHALTIEAAPWVPMLAFIAGLAVILGSLRLQSVLERWVDVRLAATLGLMTYPLYLIHQEAGAALVATLMHRGMSMLPAMIATAGTVMVFAWWVARRGEPVVRAWLAARLDAIVAMPRVYRWPWPSAR
ncbi:acyltransferase family protein [Sphingomonas sp. ERG5]|uniref:acyltransferase family protein n=1 Tax=Sphingomonas sp. ERG5 TaxID=1381597 RepID=UPI00068DC5CD|nr:acyltransferase [Sphingomonas sp. ERG5]